MCSLRRYWFEFDFSDGEHSYGWRYLPAYGCGITAYDQADALGIMRVFLLRDEGWPRFTAVIVDIDVSTIAHAHVRSNMGVPVWRGVWYPRINLSYGPYIGEIDGGAS
jgi:hypothetical protein